MPDYKRPVAPQLPVVPQPSITLPPVPPGTGTRAVGPRATDAAVKAFRRIPIFERTVFEPDDRRLVPYTTLLPWRPICALRITNADGSQVVGTGWFIDDRIVVTAGHCVYDADAGGWAKSIEVVPALNGDEQAPPFGSVIATRLRAVDGWINDKEKSCDYAAILLDTDLGRQTGAFRIAALSDAEIRGQPLNLAGYPADLDRATRLYFHARVCSTVGTNRLFYDIDTFGGQSGSPLWVNLERDGVIAVGVHTTGSALGNSGTRITPAVLENLSRWRAESAAVRSVP